MTETASPAASSARDRRRRGPLLFIRDVLVILLIAATVSFLMKTFVVRSFYIPSGSMEDTLLVNDRILVDELTPRWNDYSHGELVVFKDPGGWLPVQPQRPARSALVEGIDWVLTLIGLSTSDSEDHLVKRVIGLPGDHVVCCNSLGQITINDAPVDELSYLKLPAGSTQASAQAFDVTVPDDALWVLGDNRNRSQDSRAHQDQPGGGFVPVENVVGRAFFITWPLDRVGTFDNRSHLFNGVPPAS